jgi:hypothetical protein
MWFVRCIAWATPLAGFCYFLSGFYHRALVTIAFGVLGLAPSPEALSHVDLSAANVLGMYTAMCLASLRAPRSRRVWALVLGLAILVTIELASGVTAMRAAMLESAQGGWAPAVERTRDQMIELVRWISVPVVWLVMLGRWELRDAFRLPPVPRPIPAPGTPSAPPPPQAPRGQRRRH